MHQIFNGNPIFDDLLDVGYDIRYDFYEIVLKLDTYPKIFFLDDKIEKFTVLIPLY